MRYKASLVVFLLPLVFLGGFFSSLFAQQEDLLNLQVPTKAIRGKISDINRIKSEISVDGTDEQGKPAEMIFKISDKTRVVKNKVYVSFNSIMQGYEVVVEYYDNPKAQKPFEARIITLLQEGIGY